MGVQMCLSSPTAVNIVSQYIAWGGDMKKSRCFYCLGRYAAIGFGHLPNAYTFLSRDNQNHCQWGTCVHASVQ